MHTVSLDRLLNWGHMTQKQHTPAREKVLSTLSSSSIDHEKIPFSFLFSVLDLHCTAYLEPATFWDYKKDWQMWNVFREREALRLTDDWTNVYFVQITERYNQGMATYDQWHKALYAREGIGYLCKLDLDEFSKHKSFAKFIHDNPGALAAMKEIENIKNEIVEAKRTKFLEIFN